LGAERKLLLLLVQFRDYLDRAAERLGPEDFTDPTMREIFRTLLADPELTHPFPGMDPVAAERLEELLGAGEQLSEAAKVFEDSVAQIKKVPLARRADALREAIRSEADSDGKEALVRELAEVVKELRDLNRTDWRPALRHRQNPYETPQP
jgi:replicative DNA helicase